MVILDSLVALLKELIAKLWQSFWRSFTGSKTPAQRKAAVNQWQGDMEKLLTRWHTVAYMTGQSSPSVSEQGKAAVAKAVSVQLKYLEGFVLEVQEAEEFKTGWEARAKSYADSIGHSYWAGYTGMLPLPALPRDGTSQCKFHCTCHWEIKKLEGERNFDCYWHLSSRPGHDECQTCEVRAERWNPLKIRDGRLVTSGRS